MTSSTRIDHIWILQQFMKHVKWIFHIDTWDITKSDHKIVACRLYMAEITRNIKKFTRHASSSMNLSFRKININLKSTSKDQWIEFKDALSFKGTTWIQSALTDMKNVNVHDSTQNIQKVID